jgi:hypothetical protein
MLHCKIVACKRYLAAASGTLGNSSGTATEARLLAPRAANSTGIAQIKGKSLQDFSGKFPEMQDDIHSSRKLAAALLAGLIAIVVNTAMLEAARLDRSSPPEAAS